jgi:selenocysteine lyase/cysteine desulfurase
MSILGSNDSNRRSFMKTIAGGFLSGVALLNLPEKSKAGTIFNDIERNSIRTKSFSGGLQDYSPKDEKFWKLIRDQFPLNKNKIYMNNGTMGPSPYMVQESFVSKEEEVNQTGEYGGYDPAMERMAKFVNAGKDEIALTKNVTEGINMIAQGIKIKSGDEVIITNHEHIGNGIPWFTRAKRDGVKIKVVALVNNSDEMLNKINDAITKKTRVIAVPHLTCTQGQVLPGKEISKLGHDKGLWVMLDGAHPAGMFPVDVKDLGCDYYATCGHKWMMGPKGTGFLYVKKEMIDTIEPLMAGGGTAVDWDYENGIKSFEKNAHRFFGGSQSAAIYTGLCTAADFLDDLGMKNVAARGKYLATYLRSELKNIPNATILTPEEENSHASILGFKLKNMEYGKLQSFLTEKYNIRSRGVSESGLNALRISLHIYNSIDEVNILVKGIKEASAL